MRIKIKGTISAHSASIILIQITAPTIITITYKRAVQIFRRPCLIFQALLLRECIWKGIIISIPRVLILIALKRFYLILLFKQRILPVLSLLGLSRVWNWKISLNISKVGMIEALSSSKSLLCIILKHTLN